MRGRQRVRHPIARREGIRGSENDELTVNENAGVLSVHRVDGFEEVTCGARIPSPTTGKRHLIESTGVCRWRSLESNVCSIPSWQSTPLPTNQSW
jgi:hypothetical protein